MSSSKPSTFALPMLVRSRKEHKNKMARMGRILNENASGVSGLLTVHAFHPDTRYAASLPSIQLKQQAPD